MKTNLPTSIGGLNLRDPLDQMDKRDAIQMDNIIPDVGADNVRPGFDQISENGGLTLNGYNQEQMLLATSSEISLVDLGDGSLTSKGTGFTSGDWVSTSFTNGAGGISTFLANGQDDPQVYDGSTLATVGFTLPTPKLDSPMVFKNRLYYVAKDTLTFYYGGIQAISGALTEFDVGAFTNLGGSILKIITWTQDAGQGMDDLFVVLTSEGEAVVYKGTDPGASDWALIGTFVISKPIGKRCATKLGGDIAIITQQGYFPLAEVLSQDKANIVKISDKINNIVKGKDFTKNWSIHWFSKQGWLFINAPSSTIYDFEQHVLNFKTGGWCRFVGMDAKDWLLLGDRLFFVRANGIFEANSGNDDNGSFISYVKQPAYTVLDGSPAKQVLRATPRYNTVGNISFNERIGVDFKLGTPGLISTTTNLQEAVWDEAIWDVAFWTTEEEVSSFRSSIFSTSGMFLSVGIFGQTKQPLTFFSTQILYKAGKGDI